MTTKSKRDEIGIQTLVGEYAETGANHGRKFYNKIRKIPGHEDVKVYLYYWDPRDGPEFSGWWFGEVISDNPGSLPGKVVKGWPFFFTGDRG